MLGENPAAFYRDKRHTLYKEYLRLLAKHAPSVFIMENVKGLLSATSESGSRVFEQIVQDLQCQQSYARQRARDYSQHRSSVCRGRRNDAL